MPDYAYDGSSLDKSEADRNSGGAEQFSIQDSLTMPKLGVVLLRPVIGFLQQCCGNADRVIPTSQLRFRIGGSANDDNGYIDDVRCNGSS